MATRDDLDNWVIEALKKLGGSGSIVQVCKQTWIYHEPELKASGDFFYTWQYDIRWAANRLRRKKIMRSVEDSPTNIWELAPIVRAAAN